MNIGLSWIHTIIQVNFAVYKKVNIARDLLFDIDEIKSNNNLELFIVINQVIERRRKVKITH